MPTRTWQRLLAAEDAQLEPAKVAHYVAGDVAGACTHDECISVRYVWERRLGLLRNRHCPTHGRALHVTLPSTWRGVQVVRLTTKE